MKQQKLTVIVLILCLLQPVNGSFPIYGGRIVAISIVPVDFTNTTQLDELEFSVDMDTENYSYFRLASTIEYWNGYHEGLVLNHVGRVKSLTAKLEDSSLRVELSAYQDLFPFSSEKVNWHGQMMVQSGLTNKSSEDRPQAIRINMGNLTQLPYGTYRFMPVVNLEINPFEGQDDGIVSLGCELEVNETGTYLVFDDSPSYWGTIQTSSTLKNAVSVSLLFIIFGLFVRKRR